MSLQLFMKKNKKVKENVFYAPTKSLLDENGLPLNWEFRHVSTKEDEDIRESCTMDVQITGKPGAYRKKIDTNVYIAKLVAASCVVPNLNNAELQDSYGVKKPEDLLKELVDDPGEYQDLFVFIQKYNGFDTSMEEEVEEAKN
ncbi:MAG TPA: hypothetical protein DHW61_14025 [Lachnoclostridium phytofermentans]|uniref:XkdN-like protein n=1 Tax=Lachnoclostridium phytofermentans TaxID=66219 RepID=A0A3D2XA73_9FIRM|nr:hypothetical protein [Lachnoclostridium sp.]HCL03503.1 hypothetical protein [Lachnoclostridium phytofermentans]